MMIVDCQNDNVEWLLQHVRRPLPVVLMVVVLMLACVAPADDSVSSAFTFDARYGKSGVTPAAWVAYQAEGVSDRFSAQTVVRVVDANENGISDAWEQLYGLAGERALATADPDGDGRTNLEEYNAGTNPVVAEDWAGAMNERGPFTVDTWIASTSGGTYALTEVWALSGLFTVATAERAEDVDKDGLPDWWERLYGLDPKSDDAGLDSDGDGRTNRAEYNAGTNPVLADDWTKSSAADDDPFTVDTRVHYTGGNPTFDTAFAVIRVSDGFICDTGGLYYDWDGDGIPNWWEARYSRDGGKTGLAAADDDDHDGLSNYGEFVAYTDPTNSTSRFVIGLEPITVEPVLSQTAQASFASLKLAEPAAALSLQWNSVKGRIYSVYVCRDLSDGFPATPIVEIEGTGDVISYVLEQNTDAQFYRVSVRLSDDYGGN